MLNQPRWKRILDVGCGEGILVEEYQTKGYLIEGIDLNYESNIVRRGDAISMPFYKDGQFDIVFLIDVLEHIAFADQLQVLKEIKRVLVPRGVLFISIPNLAHLNSRWQLLFHGILDRSDIETNHIGERTLSESKRLLEDAGFKIDKVVGITLTLPHVYRQVICPHAKKFKWLHDMLDVCAIPSLALIDILWCSVI